MIYTDFEKELKEIDPRITITPNQNRPGLCNIKINGRDIIPIPEDIREEHEATYVYNFPQGDFPHTSKKEALARVQAVVEGIKDPEYHDAFFGLGDYSD